MVLGVHDLGREPQFAVRDGNEGQIRADLAVARQLDGGARGQEPSASKVGDASENTLMQSGADLFVAAARSAASQGLALEHFLVWLADRHTRIIAGTEAFSKAGWYGRTPVRI